MKALHFVGLCLLCLLLASCGGGGGGSPSGSKYSITLDSSNLSFTKTKGDYSDINKNVTATFKGDGVIAGFAPGINMPPWLSIVAGANTTNTAQFTIRVQGGIVLSPGTYNTSVRFVTGKADGSDTAHVDLPISLFIDEPFDVTTSSPLDFWVIGAQAQNVLPYGGIKLKIHGSKSNWSLSTDAKWLNLSNTTGTGEATITLKADPTQLPLGVNNATLVILDSTSGNTKSLNISFDIKASDEGQLITDSKAFEFNYNITDMLISEVNKKIYITDKINKRLYLVNSTTGLTEKFFNFDLIPEHLALSPDGKKLYVSLLTQDHSPYYWIEQQTGSVEIIDTQTETVVNEFRLNVAPGDLVVTSAGQLIVGGGSDQHVKFYFYDANTGVLISTTSASYSPVKHMELLPSEKSFYFGVTWQAPPPINRFDILDPTGVIYIAKVPSPHGDWDGQNDFWISPKGDYGLTTEGDVFKTEDSSYLTRITTENIFFKAAAFDTQKNRVLVVTIEDKLIEFDLTTWTQLRVLSQSFPNVERLSYFHDATYALIKDTSSYRFEKMNF